MKSFHLLHLRIFLPPFSCCFAKKGTCRTDHIRSRPTFQILNVCKGIENETKVEKNNIYLDEIIIQKIFCCPLEVCARHSLTIFRETSRNPVITERNFEPGGQFLLSYLVGEGGDGNNTAQFNEMDKRFYRIEGTEAKERLKIMVMEHF